MSPSSDMAVTDLPEPDSPTTASTSPAFEIEAHPVHRRDRTLLCGEGHAQVFHRQQRLVTRHRRRGLGRAHYSRIRGSRTAYRMSTTAFSNTMKKAENSVTASTGGTSSWPIDSAAYWPTP